MKIVFAYQSRVNCNLQNHAHGIFSNNNKNRNNTNIKLFKHINSFGTDIAKLWNSLRTDKQTNILTSRAAIAAKSTSKFLLLPLVTTTLSHLKRFNPNNVKYRSVSLKAKAD